MYLCFLETEINQYTRSFNMKLKSILSSITFLFVAQCVFAQEKMIQLEDIWASRTFSPEWVWGINSMNDGVHYSSLNYGDKNVYITQYSYETGDSISTIVPAVVPRI